mgnify:CR=1 FL=1
MENFFSKGVKRAVILNLLLLAIFLLIKSISSAYDIPLVREILNQEQPHNKNSRSIDFTASASVTAIPDIANFSLTVNEEADTEIAVQQKTTTKVNQAIALLKKSGIKKEDIQTQSYNTHPKYSFKTEPCLEAPCRSGKRLLVGYVASQTVAFKVRNIDGSGDILTKLAEIEISEVRGPNLSVENPDKAQSQAQAEAIKKAKIEAQETAKNLGVTLGKIMSFKDHSFSHPIGFRSKMSVRSQESASFESPDIEVGEKEFTSKVTITYAIQ